MGANVVRKCGASVDDGPSVLFVVADLLTWIVRFVSQRSVFYRVSPVITTLCDMECSFRVTKVSVL